MKEICQCDFLSLNYKKLTCKTTEIYNFIALV